MRENRTYGSEGGESGITGLPYPYRRNWYIQRPLTSELGRYTPEASTEIGKLFWDKSLAK